jgi:hypothetical protein
LTGGTAEGLRVIELLPDQHHLSNVMSLITSSLNTQTHLATVVGVKRLEGETLYCLSNQRTHIVSINYQVEGPAAHRNLVSIWNMYFAMGLEIGRPHAELTCRSQCR